jgi:hypothetical protein
MKRRGSLSAIFICLLLLSFSLPYVVHTQGVAYRKFWSLAIRMTDVATGATKSQKTDPPVAIILAPERITIYSRELQQYEIVSAPTVHDNDNEQSLTWTCADAKGVPVLVTFGMLRKPKEIQLLIEYPALKWVYLLQQDSQ